MRLRALEFSKRGYRWGYSINSSRKLYRNYNGLKGKFQSLLRYHLRHMSLRFQRTNRRFQTGGNSSILMFYAGLLDPAQGGKAFKFGYIAYPYQEKAGRILTVHSIIVREPATALFVADVSSAI